AGLFSHLQDLADHRRVHALGAPCHLENHGSVSVKNQAGRCAGKRLPTNTVAITASAKPSVRGSSRSPSSGTANSSDRNGWTSCTWLTRTVPPIARPRYQAKKPI